MDAISANNARMKRRGTRNDGGTGKRGKIEDGWMEESRKMRMKERGRGRKRISASEELETNNFAFWANGHAYMCLGTDFRRRAAAGYEFRNLRPRRARSSFDGLWNRDFATSTGLICSIWHGGFKVARKHKESYWLDCSHIKRMTLTM